MPQLVHVVGDRDDGGAARGDDGEGAAHNEAAVFGSENGALIYQDGEITKVTLPDRYGRIGNACVSDTSPLVVMDYKDDPDAEGYLLPPAVKVAGDIAYVTDPADSELVAVDLTTGEIVTTGTLDHMPNEIAVVS